MELDIIRIENELGKLSKIEQLCPSVWYAAFVRDSIGSNEYYIADTDAQCLSDYAKSLGKSFEDVPGLLFYLLDEVDGGKFVVQYEVQRWLKQHSIPLPDGDDLLTTAVSGTEHHPDYFGDYPAPLITPRGMTTRRCQLAKGVCAVETENCDTMVALCSPIWLGDLSDYVIKLGEQTDGNELGYRFFPQPADSLALFELRQTYEEIAKSKHINWPALMNAIWQHFPEYAASHNSREQRGLNDVSGLLFRSLGFDTELRGSEENLITLSLNEGDIYLEFANTH